MNELLFFFQAIISLGFVLLAFRLGYVYLVGLVAALVALMNIFVIKQMTLFGFAITGGNVLYASIFLSTDIISEHYGKEKALQTVRIGFGVGIFFLLMSQFILRFTPNEFDIAQPAFKTLFKLAPRIVIGSLAAYLMAQHADVLIFHFLKKTTQGKFLWLRNNLSTLCSQLIDTLTFTLIAFYGVFPNLWEILLTTYVVKIIIAALDTPFIYLSKMPFFLPNDLKKT